MATTNPYVVGLERNLVNDAPLLLLGVLKCTALIYPKRISIIQGRNQYTRKEIGNGCRPLVSALIKRDIGKGKSDTVAVMPTIAAMFDCQSGVPFVLQSAIRHEKYQYCHLRPKSKNVALEFHSARFGSYEIVCEKQGNPRRQINDRSWPHCKTCHIKEPDSEYPLNSASRGIPDRII